MVRYLLAFFLILLSCTVKIYSQQIDAGFHCPVVLRQSFVTSMVVQPDGNILVGGEIAYHGNKPINNLLRIKPDGSHDGTFVFQAQSNYMVDDVALLPSGDIAVLLRQYNAGREWLYSFGKIVIVNNAGAIIRQSEEMENLLTLAVLPDGKFLIGNQNQNGIQRLNPDLSADPAFNVATNGAVLDIQVQGGNIFASGSFSQVNGVTKNDIVKLNLDGSIDNTFDTGTGTSDRVGSLTILPDGKVLPGTTYINSFNGVIRSGNVRLNADGSVDNSFSSFYFNGPIGRPLVAASDIYVSSFMSRAGVYGNYLVRLNDNGTLDESFTPVAFKDGSSYDTRVVTIGDELMISGPVIKGNDYGLIKTNSSGVVNSDFHPKLARLGVLRFGERVEDKVMVGGDFLKIDSLNTNGIARINLDGTLDDSFVIKENIGSVRQMQLLEDGKILVTTYKNFFKVDANGVRDEDFRWELRNPLYQVIKFALRPDGKIIVADPNTLTRLNANGSYDNSFDLGHTSSSTAFDFDFQGENIIYGFLGGMNTEFNRQVPVIKRVLPDASYDPSFSASGPELTSKEDFALVDLIKVLDNGEILVGGYFKQYAGLPVARGLVKLSANGTIDKTFNDNQLTAGGPSGFGDATCVQIGDKIYIKGSDFIYAINMDGSVNQFDLPLGIDVIHDIVVVTTDGSASGRTLEADDELLALGSFYNTTTQSRGAIVKLKLAKAEVVEEITSIEERAVLNMEFFPNPTADHLRMKVANTNAGFRVEVFGTSGLKVTDQQFARADEAGNILDVSGLPPGVYAIRVSTSNGKMAVAKFVRKP